MLSASIARREALWYVPIMQSKSLPTDALTEPTLGRPSAPRRRLSVVHADALYRPVPPVELDDDGHICRDSRVSESTTHRELIVYAFNAARSLLAHLPDALVGSDLAILFERDNPAAVVSPDLMVAFNAGCHHRDSYKLWEERSVPDLALEFLSEKTWRRDVEVKPGLYRDLGVREFWIVDPLDKLPDPIVGWRLSDAGPYEEIPTSPSGGRRSDVLGAELFHDGQRLQFLDLATGDVKLTYEESERLRERERAAAEKRIAALEERLQRLEGP